MRVDRLVERQTRLSFVPCWLFLYVLKINVTKLTNMHSRDEILCEKKTNCIRKVHSNLVSTKLFLFSRVGLLNHNSIFLSH